MLELELLHHLQPLPREEKERTLKPSQKKKKTQTYQQKKNVHKSVTKPRKKKKSVKTDDSERLK